MDAGPDVPACFSTGLPVSLVTCRLPALGRSSSSTVFVNLRTFPTPVPLTARYLIFVPLCRSTPGQATSVHRSALRLASPQLALPERLSAEAPTSRKCRAVLNPEETTGRLLVNTVVSLDARQSGLPICPTLQPLYIHTFTCPLSN